MADKPLQAGDLDRRLDILSLGNHVNTLGEIESSSYGPYLQNVPCRFRPAKGSETDENDRVTAFGRGEFDLRYRADLTETMRIVYEGAEYDILNVREGQGRRQWLVLTVQKRN